MHFYYVAGKQHLDLTGNLILSKNPQLVSAPAKSAAPKTHRGSYILVERLTFLQRLRVTYIAVVYIWGSHR